MKKNILCLMLIFVMCFSFFACSKPKTYDGFIWYQTGKDDPELLYDAVYSTTGTDIPPDATIKVLHDSITGECEGFALIEVDYSTSVTLPSDMTIQLSIVDGWEEAKVGSQAYNRLKEAFDYLNLTLPSFENAFTYYESEMLSEEIDEEVASYVGFWNEEGMKYYVLCMLTLEVTTPTTV